ncbi:MULTISPECIES: hypothetical protein [Micrococcaceae]|uniref:hypothetical protein n=1 Tax=Micrococcaceae TaxID=1268 RepID=UPI001414D08F|nr:MULTISPECIES: hypothetical protein [Micrococcaceae]
MRVVQGSAISTSSNPARHRAVVSSANASASNASAGVMKYVLTRNFCSGSNSGGNSTIGRLPGIFTAWNNPQCLAVW